jgi:hypothetical protein
MQWNATVERELGANQRLTATYVGADARRLLLEDTIFPPLLTGFGNPLGAIRNAGYAHYEALQIQFQRRMSHGIQALMSYNFAKASDLGSTDENLLTVASASVSQVALPPLTPSDFDIRNSVAGAVSYEVPSPFSDRAGNAILKGWAVDGLVRVSSAPPINVTTGPAFLSAIGYYSPQVNIVPGQPFWIADSTQPAGRSLNPAAFSRPAINQTGDFPRNELRSPYSVDQTDLALRRRFNLTERVNLNVRAEYFNVFNHPMFGAPGYNQPNTVLGRPGFGQMGPASTTNLALGGGGTVGGQSAQYTVGGPRSAQFTVKLQF